MAIREAAKLRNAELFQGLPDAAVQEVLKSSTRRDLFAGATLLKQGDEPECLFMVLEGRLRITALGKDGVQKTLHFMGPGEVVGCAAAFRRVPYPATATAVNDSTVLSWSLVKLDQLLREYPPIAANALSIISFRTTEMLQRLREVTSDSVEQRIAAALLRLQKQRVGSSEKDEASMAVLRVSRQDIAEFSDTSLFTVSRTISGWSRAGILKGGREKVTLLDVARLEQIANGAKQPS